MDDLDNYEDWHESYLKREIVKPGTFSHMKFIKDKMIYIGDAYAGEDINGLRERNIKHIISVGGSIDDYVTFDEIEYHRIILDDSFDSDILFHIKTTNALIDNIDEPLLIHCHMGISRSVSILIGYLISKGNSFHNSLNMIRNCRECAYPNFGFEIQLRSLDNSDNSNERKRRKK